MPRNEPIYPRGHLAKTARDVLLKYSGKHYYASEVIKQIKILLPNALEHSIKGLITYEYIKRGWAAETQAYDAYVLTDNFFKRKSKSTRKSVKPVKKDVVSKSPHDELTFVEIGRGIVAYVNELKALTDIAEEDNIKLTKQVNKLQEAFNNLKMQGSGIGVNDLM